MDQGLVTNSEREWRILGLIPARGGSKGIPKKNLFPIMAKPLLQYTFEAAKECGVLSDIMISSEDDEILHFARLHGFDTSYRRPKELGSDVASTVDVVEDLLQWLETRNQLPDILVLLQPTSPLRSADDISRAIIRFIELGADSMVSVHKMVEHPFKSMHQKADGEWHYLARPEQKSHRRQDYDANYYTINGALYLVKPQWFRDKKALVVENETKLFEMSPIAGMDVDELVDVFKVEAYLKMLS
ncbi:MAG: acylneuraminate cytidylyltransferase family protein [Epsilonproteobacteria bacterium]|nr:acylneuraminate cytidylyltransferase family protein [Campylobacterota bacterium]